MNKFSSNPSSPSIPIATIRNLDNGLFVTASANLGKSAVSSQVRMLPEVDTKEPSSQLDQVYQGVIEINHDDTATNQPNNSIESTEKQKPSVRQVHNHYIEEPKRTLKELENQYPNESPLLAPN